MNGRLEQGTVLRTARGSEVRIESLIGMGGQGEVYRARSGGRNWALKWYLPELTTRAQRVIIEGVVGKNIRDPRFLWPRELVEHPKGPGEGFGYLMELRPADFTDLPSLFRRDSTVSAATRRTLLAVALSTAESFRYLHKQGLAYQDINWGNLFFNPDSGRILICDNDNAVPDGTPSSVLGTVDFMAPELVRGDPGAFPTTQTDLHALAVLLFMLLMNHHPLEGAAALRIHCMDAAAKHRLNGTDPVFVFDPENDTNRPVPGEQDTVLTNWAATPASLRSLFIKAFTVGMRDPLQRVREFEWRDALREVHDGVVRCPKCRRQNIFESGANAPAVSCWNCSIAIAAPPRLVVTTGTGRVRVSHTIRVSEEAEVHGFHLGPDPEIHDFTHPVAFVVPHPSMPGRFGLTNSTTASWKLHSDDAAGPREVPPGKRAALREGLLIELGSGAEAVFHEH